MSSEKIRLFLGRKKRIWIGDRDGIERSVGGHAESAVAKVVRIFFGKCAVESSIEYSRFVRTI